MGSFLGVCSDTDALTQSVFTYRCSKNNITELNNDFTYLLTLNVLTITNTNTKAGLNRLNVSWMLELSSRGFIFFFTDNIICNYFKHFLFFLYFMFWIWLTFIIYSDPKVFCSWVTGSSPAPYVLRLSFYRSIQGSNPNHLLSLPSFLCLSLGVTFQINA